MKRHFQKYYFYFIGRLLDLLGQYDRSIACYSKVIRFRTFFWDVQKRFTFAFEQGSKTCTLEIHGGMGDILQHLPFILKNKSARYIVVSHFLGAKEFFESLNVQISEYYFYQNAGEYETIRKILGKLTHSFWCPKQLFFDRNPFQSKTKLKFEAKRVVGFQIGSSRLTNKPLQVNFAIQLIRELIKCKCTVILFGTKEELSQIKIKPNQQLLFADDNDITKNLSLVKYCKLLIGGESVFKTMSSMLKIKTLVYHEDYKNHFRDRVFINPYLNADVMHVYKYKKLEGQESDQAIEFALSLIKKDLKWV